MKEGNLRLLDQGLRENQYRLIQAGTFLLIEKLKLFVHRRLFKLVALLHREQEPAKAERLPLGERARLPHWRCMTALQAFWGDVSTCPDCQVLLAAH